MKNPSEMVYSLQNIAEGQGVDIAITGMSIVFTALALISLFIFALPRILAMWSPETSAVVRSTAGQDLSRPEEDEVVAAIGLALHTGRNR